MKLITSLDQLHEQLDQAEKTKEISDDAFRKFVSEWRLSPDIIGEVPTDPFSEEYKAFQLEFYEKLTTKRYAVDNEETFFDFEYELTNPYPYGTKSAATVGAHLMGYGWLLRKMDLPVSARILEIGSGYGPLTEHLARMGYEVTCLDISASLLKFVEARTAQFSSTIKTICGDMATVEINEIYDAVIFNASLHHTAEHRAVIERLNHIVKPNGRVAFIAEPIVKAGSEHVPYPWGLRLGGLSIWSICRFGWLELGFQEAYFTQLMNNAGWRLTRCDLGVTGNTDVWLATRGESQAEWPPVISSITADYDIDAESELKRLRLLVEGYEQGRVIRLINWAKRFL